MSDAQPIFLALFAYNAICPGTLDCLLRDLPALPRLLYHRQSQDALISRSRSVAASDFLRSPADVMLMIDHDISWQPGDLSRLIASVRQTTSVVSGIYPKRSFGNGVAVRFAEPGRYTIGDDRLVPGQYLSTGFFAVHRDVFEAMAPTLRLTTEGFWPFFMPMLSACPSGESPEYLSEDWAFCERARTLGFRLHVDLKPILSHSGAHAFRLIDSQLPLPPDASITLQASENPALPLAKIPTART